MSLHTRSPNEGKRIAEQAAKWLITLEQAGPREQAAFAVWLTESRRHIEEFLFASAIEKALDGVDAARRFDIEQLLAKTSANVVPLRHALTSPARPRPTEVRRTWRLRWLAGIAAAVAIVALAAGWLYPYGWQNFSTDIGEQRAVRLADGSVVQLNTRSELQVRFTATVRDLRLLAGEAVFEVERDPARPFRVDAGSAVVQAIGTQFNINRREEATTVSVIEGVVQVLPNSVARGPRPQTDGTGAIITPFEPARLGAGEQAQVIRGSQTVKRDALDLERVVAWRQRRLMFRNDTLADIAAEFNRYNRAPQIRVEGKTIRAKRYTAIFNADDPESLVEYLVRNPELRFEKRADEFVIRQR